MPKSHIHGCPDCDTVTIHFCFGGVDENGRCEYEDGPNEVINSLCETCYAAREQDQMWERISLTQAVVMMLKDDDVIPTLARRAAERRARADAKGKP